MLSPKPLEALREYWRGLQPKEWLFPAGRWHTRSHRIDTKTIWNACQEATQRAGIKKRCTRSSGR